MSNENKNNGVTFALKSVNFSLFVSFLFSISLMRDSNSVDCFSFSAKSLLELDWLQQNTANVDACRKSNASETMAPQLMTGWACLEGCNFDTLSHMHSVNVSKKAETDCNHNLRK